MQNLKRGKQKPSLAQQKSDGASAHNKPTRLERLQLLQQQRLQKVHTTITVSATTPQEDRTSRRSDDPIVEGNPGRKSANVRSHTAPSSGVAKIGANRRPRHAGSTISEMIKRFREAPALPRADRGACSIIEGPVLESGGGEEQAQTAERVPLSERQSTSNQAFWWQKGSKAAPGEEFFQAPPQTSVCEREAEADARVDAVIERARRVLLQQDPPEPSSVWTPSGAHPPGPIGTDVGSEPHLTEGTPPAAAAQGGSRPKAPRSQSSPTPTLDAALARAKKVLSEVPGDLRGGGAFLDVEGEGRGGADWQLGSVDFQTVDRPTPGRSVVGPGGPADLAWSRLLDENLAVRKLEAATLGADWLAAAAALPTEPPVGRRRPDSRRGGVELCDPDASSVLGGETESAEFSSRFWAAAADLDEVDGDGSLASSGAGSILEAVDGWPAEQPGRGRGERWTDSGILSAEGLRRGRPAGGVAGVGFQRLVGRLKDQVEDARHTSAVAPSQHQAGEDILAAWRRRCGRSAAGAVPLPPHPMGPVREVRELVVSRHSGRAAAGAPSAAPQTAPPPAARHAAPRRPSQAVAAPPLPAGQRCFSPEDLWSTDAPSSRGSSSPDSAACRPLGFNCRSAQSLSEPSEASSPGSKSDLSWADPADPGSRSATPDAPDRLSDEFSEDSGSPSVGGESPPSRLEAQELAGAHGLGRGVPLASARPGPEPESVSGSLLVSAPTADSAAASSAGTGLEVFGSGDDPASSAVPTVGPRADMLGAGVHGSVGLEEGRVEGPSVERGLACVGSPSSSPDLDRTPSDAPSSRKAWSPELRCLMDSTIQSCLFQSSRSPSPQAPSQHPPTHHPHFHPPPEDLCPPVKTPEDLALAPSQDPSQTALPLPTGPGALSATPSTSPLLSPPLSPDLTLVSPSAPDHHGRSAECLEIDSWNHSADRGHAGPAESCCAEGRLGSPSTGTTPLGDPALSQAFSGLQDEHHLSCEDPPQGLDLAADDRGAVPGTTAGGSGDQLGRPGLGLLILEVSPGPAAAPGADAPSLDARGVSGLAHGSEAVALGEGGPGLWSVTPGMGDPGLPERVLREACLQLDCWDTPAEGLSADIGLDTDAGVASRSNVSLVGIGPNSIVALTCPAATPPSTSADICGPKAEAEASGNGPADRRGGVCEEMSTGRKERSEALELTVVPVPLIGEPPVANQAPPGSSASSHSPAAGPGIGVCLPDGSGDVDTECDLGSAVTAAGPAAVAAADGDFTEPPKLYSSGDGESTSSLSGDPPLAERPLVMSPGHAVSAAADVPAASIPVPAPQLPLLPGCLVPTVAAPAAATSAAVGAAAGTAGALLAEHGSSPPSVPPRVLEPSLSPGGAALACTLECTLNPHVGPDYGRQTMDVLDQDSATAGTELVIVEAAEALAMPGGVQFREEEPSDFEDLLADLVWLEREDLWFSEGDEVARALRREIAICRKQLSG